MLDGHVKRDPFRAKYLPYLIHRRRDGMYVLLDRNYKLIGNRTGSWDDYDSSRFPLRLSKSTLKKLHKRFANNGGHVQYGEREGTEDIYQLWFYQDGASLSAKRRAGLDALAIIAEQSGDVALMPDDYEVEFAPTRLSSTPLPIVGINKTLGPGVCDSQMAALGFEVVRKTQYFTTYGCKREECELKCQVDITKMNTNGEVVVVTNAQDEQAFLNALSARMLDLVTAGNSGKHKLDWEHDVPQIIARAIEIACSIRGYKSEVKKAVIMCAGSAWPADTKVWSTAEEQGAE